MLAPLAALLALSPADLGREAAPGLSAIRPEAIAAHVRFLADDLLEGRRSGERGHAIAERYVAARFEALGLRPAGEGEGWLQEVRLRELRADPARSSLTMAGGRPLRAFEDYLWRATRYHQPSDDLGQPLDWSAAAAWARFEFLVALSVVQADRRPAWKQDDFFTKFLASHR